MEKNSRNQKDDTVTNEQPKIPEQEVKVNPMSAVKTVQMPIKAQFENFLTKINIKRKDE